MLELLVPKQGGVTVAYLLMPLTCVTVRCCGLFLFCSVAGDDEWFSMLARMDVPLDSSTVLSQSWTPKVAARSISCGIEQCPEMLKLLEAKCQVATLVDGQIPPPGIVSLYL